MKNIYIVRNHIYMFIESYGLLSLPVGTVVAKLNESTSTVLGYNDILGENFYFPSFAISNRDGHFVDPASELEINEWYIKLYEKKISKYQDKIKEIQNKIDNVKKRELTK